MGPAASALHPQHLLFVEEYLKNEAVDGAITKAAIRAGYSISNATAQGSRLLGKPHIKKAIAELKQASATRVGITQDMILQELSKIAFAPTENTIQVDEEGNETVNVSFPNEAVVTTTGGKNKSKTVTMKSVKLADKIAALEKMGKHLGMFKDQVEVSAAVSLLDLVERSLVVKQPSPVLIEEADLVDPADPVGDAEYITD